MVAWTDASDTGWGVALQTLDKSNNAPLQRHSGFWTKKGIQNHINIKELLAIEQAVRRAPPEQRLLIYTDSTVALAYARRLTGRIASLHAIAARIFQQLRAKRTTLEVRHIPGLENTEADTLSRQSTQHEWCVTRASFRQATTILGVKPTTDLFSSNVAFQKDCDKRFSRFQNDAFALPDWSTRTLGPQPLWIAPPVRLIAEVLARLRATEDRATSVVVVPLWRGTKWWPLLVELMGPHLQVTAVKVQAPPTGWPTPALQKTKWVACLIPSNEQSTCNTSGESRQRPTRAFVGHSSRPTRI